MDDWEDEQVPALLKKDQSSSKWDDEDLDEDEIKDSWEDEDEPTPKPAPASAPEKASKKPAADAKGTDKKGKVAEVVKEVQLDPVAEKLRQQRLVEEADFKSTAELFGKKGDEKTLDNFIPKSESDFMEYAELISNKLRPYEKSFHYLGLLKAVMRHSMTSLKAADAKEVASSITAIANEKLKAEKEAAAGKKKIGGKKKQLHVDRPDDDLAINAYDTIDDYDFMFNRHIIIVNHHLSKGRRAKIKKIRTVCMKSRCSTPASMPAQGKVMNSLKPTGIHSKSTCQRLPAQGNMISPPISCPIKPYIRETQVCSSSKPSPSLIYNHHPLHLSLYLLQSLLPPLLNVFMDSNKRSYKNALFSKGKEIMPPDPFTDQNSTPFAEKAGVESQTNAIPSAEKAYEGMVPEFKPTFIDLNGFLRKLAKVEDNVKMLKETTIFLTFWKGTAKASRLKNKLRMEWQFLKGEFELIDRTNNWFEVKFANPIDRDTVWDNRPYYAFGNLTVLNPWVSNFDPVAMEIRTVDVWARILYFPTEYITVELVGAIIEHNDIGKFIRLDPFTENRIRIKYARVCICINKQEKPKNYVIIPALTGEYRMYKVWYEGISTGCGSSGEEEHSFETCPLRTVANRNRTYKTDRVMKKEITTSNNYTEESSVEKGKGKKEWKEVRYNKGKTSQPNQSQKPTQQRHDGPSNDPDDKEGIGEGGAKQTESMNVQQQIIHITKQGLKDNNLHMPQFQPTAFNIDQGPNTQKSQQQEEDSFKTGHAGTTLTEKMKVVNVEEDSDQSKRKEANDTMDSASTNSKRARLTYDADDE